MSLFKCQVTLEKNKTKKKHFKPGLNLPWIWTKTCPTQAKSFKNWEKNKNTLRWCILYLGMRLCLELSSNIQIHVTCESANTCHCSKFLWLTQNKVHFCSMCIVSAFKWCNLCRKSHFCILEKESEHDLFNPNFQSAIRGWRGSSLVAWG